jgi:hypothetical protein
MIFEKSFHAYFTGMEITVAQSPEANKLAIGRIILRTNQPVWRIEILNRSVTCSGP